MPPRKFHGVSRDSRSRGLHDQRSSSCSRFSSSRTSQKLVSMRRNETPACPSENFLREPRAKKGKVATTRPDGRCCALRYARNPPVTSGTKLRKVTILRGWRIRLGKTETGFRVRFPGNTIIVNFCTILYRIRIFSMTMLSKSLTLLRTL